MAATPTSNAPSMSLSSGNASGSGSNGAKASDELRFSGHTLDKATKAKLTLENYYSTLISQHKERKERWKRLEESLRVSPVLKTSQSGLLLIFVLLNNNTAKRNIKQQA